MPNSPSSNAPSISGATDKPKPTFPDQEKIRTDADALLSEVKSVGGKVADEAMEQVGQIADVAKAQVEEATGKFKGLAGEQKELLATQIGGVADALQRVAGDLESSNGASAQYARTIANGAERLSSTLRDNDVDQIVEIAQDFGRRQPAAFMGAAALLGFAASRFVLASAKRREVAAPASLDAPAANGASDYLTSAGGSNGAR
jgi:hypothetical protein